MEIIFGIIALVILSQVLVFAWEATKFIFALSMVALIFLFIYSFFTDLWVLSVAIVIFIIILITKFMVFDCEICEAEFTDRMKKYSIEYEDKKITVCSACNRKLSNKKSSEKFENFINSQNPISTESKQTLNSRVIPSSVKQEVWRRDYGKCVQCSSNENLEYDHIIPFSKGGSNSVRNIQLLCQKCNRAKSAKIQ